DIAYSIHDVEDFYEAGRIPLDQLVHSESERESFYEGVRVRWNENGGIEGLDEHIAAFEQLIQLFPDEPFLGTRKQRSLLRSLTSKLIEKYISAFTLDPTAQPPVVIAPIARRETTMLKQLTWHYVILHPSLATEQHAQKHIIRSLFGVYLQAIRDDEWSLLPKRTIDGLEERLNSMPDHEREREKVRCVVDLIAGMTEPQAIQLYQRLFGYSSGSGIEALIV
ncbi:MAG: hypothetical protein MI741_11860, partial [Rhodospirillales bacterium]|nr:hypothetical protein [Rhodospirillales bacterium]